MLAVRCFGMSGNAHGRGIYGGKAGNRSSRNAFSEFRVQSARTFVLLIFEPETTSETIGARFHCEKYQLRDSRIESRYVGPTRDFR